MSTHLPPILLAVTVCVLALPARGLAAGGVREINDACARRGCFVGDTAGYPVTITTPGSYRLSGNLAVTTGGVDGVRISVSDVHLDLAGFRIQGPNSCRPCTLTGSGSGIVVTNDATVARVTVERGTVRGMPAAGIDLGPGSVVRYVRAFENGTGIEIGDDGAVIGSIVERNGGDGISGSTGLRVETSVATNNGSRGVAAGASAQVSTSAASNCGGTGFALGLGSSVETTWARLNQGGGIQAGLGSVVFGSAALNNSSFSGDGIRVEDGSTLTAVLATGNSNDGLSAGAASTIASSGSMQNGGSPGDVGLDAGPRALVRGNTVEGGLTLGDDASYRENRVKGSVLLSGGGAFSNQGGNYCTNSAGNPFACP